MGFTTENIASVASHSERFIMVSNSINFFIVIPLLSNICNKASALAGFFEKNRACGGFQLTIYAKYPSGSVR